MTVGAVSYTHLERYSRILAEKRAREGFTYEEANDKMFERNYFGMMMVETGDADAFITCGAGQQQIVVLTAGKKR